MTIIASNTNKKNKIFHYPTCKYAAIIKDKNLIKFNNKDDARCNGYTHCTHCSRLLKYYEQDKDIIDKFIKSNNLQMYIEDDSMYIENTFASWKITIESDGYGLVLYHGNTESYHKLEKKDGHIIHHYHLQKYRGLKDIMSMLEYIIEHDNWKNNHVSNSYKKLPTRTKNQRKVYNKAKKTAKRTEIRNLYNLIDRISLEMESEKDKNK